MKTNQTIAAIAVLSASVLAGCAAPGYQNQPDSQYPASYPPSYPAGSYPPSYPASNAPAYYSGYGVIDSIQVVQQSSGSSGIGAGAVVGGVVGGVLGNQVGQGTGRTAATAAGVVGGALVGNQIQKSNQPVREAYQINVRLDNGTYLSVVQDSVSDLRVGNRVRVENNRVYRY